MVSTGSQKKQPWRACATRLARPFGSTKFMVLAFLCLCAMETTLVLSYTQYFDFSLLLLNNSTWHEVVNHICPMFDGDIIPPTDHALQEENLRGQKVGLFLTVATNTLGQFNLWICIFGTFFMSASQIYANLTKPHSRKVAWVCLDWTVKISLFISGLSTLLFVIMAQTFCIVTPPLQMVAPVIFSVSLPFLATLLYSCDRYTSALQELSDPEYSPLLGPQSWNAMERDEETAGCYCCVA